MEITLCNNDCPFYNLEISECKLNSDIKVDKIGFSHYDKYSNKIYGAYSENCKLIKIKTLEGTFKPEKITI